ncbi:MAG: hydroxyacylglutathione hydrolase [Chlamydiales bacterium]|jgi:hydroxyacylglutathione hydrolase
MDYSISLIPALSDNYIYLIEWGSDAVIIDPAEATPVLSILKKKDLNLLYILNTHHHHDHVGGNEELKEETGCQIIGPYDDRIPGIDVKISQGEEVTIGPLTYHVIEVPGHTSSHIAFYVQNQPVLFCGDALFAGGCGRLFEGTAEQMHESLQKIATLPFNTRIFCGHEYTVKNLSFAASIEPDNLIIKARLKDMEKLREEGKPTIPSNLGIESKTNPFLRVADKALRKSLNMEDADDVEVFAHIRSLRNNY